MAEEALKKAGHEVVHWQPPNTMWALSQAYATNVFGDGGKVFVEAVQNDIWEDHIKDIIYLSMMPAWLKKFIASTIAPLIFPRYLINYLTSSSGSGTISNLWKDEAEIKEYRRMVVKEMEKQEIDAILCPSMPVPAMRIGECKDAVGVVVYTALFNVLNFPSGAVPITKVTTEDIEKDMVNFPTKDMWHKAIKKNLEGSKGLPVGVQCASLPFYEERCLRMMKDLEKQIGYDVLIEYQN
ncbi:FAAH [Bugula neritina]|uniref:FAAH n=1 Tax=Bugula neritina TaxID=10212 RepID=A0A7J7J1M2_BUGNE|nr:FAAH [Bugula neritina]